ncbi:related to IVY1 - phospholipid-binding protein [Ustilago sp. UG-2017b]|nr:related to IVY1 - phospholipid-binding protein [Ustilago sp. UG-2017b]
MPRPHSIRSLQMPHHSCNQAFPQAPPSPSLSTTTRASLDLPSRPAVLITRADLRTSLAAYEALLASAKAYTSAMLAMAKASSDLACALETCARVKGAHESGPGLQAASGLHFLKSNYEQVLCDTFWKDFSIPLLSHYDTYRSACTDRQVSHDKAVASKSKELKQAEARNNRAGRKKERDLNSFRRALAELQSHVDAIDQLKAQYYNEVLDAEQEVWQFIESKVALVVRSQIEISERISSKGLNDPVLEAMLATIPDPFGSYGPAKQDGEIFSILPPISLLSSGANSIHDRSTEAAATTNETSVTDGDVRTEDVRPTPTGVVGGKSKSVLPADIMSPSTPSKGLWRAGQASAIATPTHAGQSATDDLPSSSTPKGNKGASASTAATPKASRSSKSTSLNGPTHLARDSLLGLSAVSEATTAVSTSDGSSPAASGGLFGSESVDFEQLLSKEQHASQDDRTQEEEQHPTLTLATQTIELANRDAAEDQTATSRLRQVLSIIEEDANGPLSRAAKVGPASRPVSSVYDAGPGPFADPAESPCHAREALKDGSEDGSESVKANSTVDEAEQKHPNQRSRQHCRTPSKMSIDQSTPP